MARRRNNESAPSPQSNSGPDPSLPKDQKLLKEIENLNKRINDDKRKQKKTSEELLDIEKKLAEVLTRQSDTEEERLKNLEEYNDLLEKKKKKEEESKKRNESEQKHIEDRNKKLREYNDISEKRSRIESDIKSMVDDQSLSFNLLEKKQQSLNKNTESYKENFDSALSIITSAQNALNKGTQILEKQGSLSSEYLSTLSQTKETSNSLADIQTQMTIDSEKASRGEYEKRDLSQQLLDIDTRRFILNRIEKEVKEGTSEVTEEELEHMKSMLQTDETHLQALVNQNQTLADSSDAAKKVLSNFEKLTSLDIKGYLISKFGLDEIQKQVKDKIGGAFVNVAEQYKKGGLVAGIKSAGKELGGIMKMLPKLGAAFAITGLVAGFAALGKMVMHADEEIANMGKELGVSHHEAALLHGETQKMASSMNIVGLNAKEVYEGVKIVGDAMGGLDIGAQLAAGNKEIEGFVKQASVLSKEFGLSGEEISQIKNLATLTGKSMDDLVKESVELGKGTMTAKQTLKVLSTIPPEVSVAFKGSTKELIAAAQKAKLLGMELSKVHGIGQGMLEIEDSLGKEMEARVLTGKNLNLDAARMYALQGDTFKLQEEILNQAGSLEDFTKMNTIQQDSMAKALGMSVEEMTKMLTNAEKLKKADISSDYAERLQAMESAADLEKEAAGARSKEQKDYIMQLAAEKRSASLKEKMADMMEKIKAKLAPIVERIVAMAHSLFDSTKGASMFDDILAKIDIEEIIHGVKESLPKIMEAIKGLIQNLPKIISFVSGLVEKFAGAGGALGGIVGMLNPSIAGFGMLALKVGGPGGVAKGFEFAFKGAGKLFDVVKGPLSAGVGKLGESVTGKLGGAFGKVADKAKDSLGSVMEKMGKVKTPPTPKGDGGGGFMKSLADGFKKINTTDLIKAAVALAILAGALWITAKAMQEFNTVNFDAFLMGVGALFALAGVALILGKLKGSIIEGSLAMVIMAGALYVLGAALLQFNDVDWPSLGKAALAIVGLTAAIFGLGALISGPGAILFAAGVVGFMALGMAAGVLGLGLQVLGNGIASIGGGIESLFKQMEKLYDMDPDKFETIADKIGILGKAISDIGSGALTSAIGGGLSALFGTKSPIDQVSEIMTKLDASKLDGTSAAIRSLADAFKYFAEETTKLKDFDTDKLDTIIEKMKEVQEAEAAGSMSKAVTGVATAVSGFITNLFGSSEEQKSQPVSAGGATGAAVNTGGGTNMANVEKKLDTLISVLSQAANQPLVIKFGEKTIEEIKSQLSLRKATDIGVNKGYAKTI